MSFRAPRRRQWVGLRPTVLRNNQRLDAQTRPPLRFFDGAMHLAMMHPAERRELIADLATERPGLGEPHGHPNWRNEANFCCCLGQPVKAVAVRRAELADEKTTMTAANNLAIRRALEIAGVEFIDENGGGPGVRLSRHRRAKTRTS